jgi:hypothetical protein|tara:strand:- start:6314 stop:6553 length:240 start_codon:yes stop_codon:yes gene_type:complete
MNDIELMFDGYKIIAEYTVSDRPEDPESGLFGTIEVINVKYVEELTDAPSIDELICDTAWQVINDACHEHSAGCFNEDY